MRPLRCLLCRDAWVSVEGLFCARCRAAAASTESLTNMARDLQQYRLVMGSRFSDSKRFHRDLRAAALSAGFREIIGPASIRVVGQRSLYQGDLVSAYRLVEHALTGYAIGQHTDLQSISVTLIKGGNLLTVVEARALLDDELAGFAGVGR